MLVCRVFLAIKEPIGRLANNKNIPSDPKYEDWPVIDFNNEYCKNFKEGCLERCVWAWQIELLLLLFHLLNAVTIKETWRAHMNTVKGPNASAYILSFNQSWRFV